MKIRIFFTFLIFNILYAQNIPNLLNENYQELYNLKLKKEEAQKKYNSLKFISPVELSVERDISYKYKNRSSRYTKYSISIDQPIFKFGGIYYGIKFAKANYKLNKLKILKEERELIIKAIQLAYELKASLYEKKKTQLEIKNKKIELKMYETILESGYISSLDIDNLLVKLTDARTKLYDIKMNIKQTFHRFKQISYKNPYKLKLPKLKFISKNKFIQNNYDIKLAKKNIELMKYKKKITYAKYLPTISIGLEYGKIKAKDIEYRNHYKNINLKMSMPISVNRSHDIEIAKLEYLISKLELVTTKNTTINDYTSIKNRLSLYAQKRKLLEEEMRIYRKLLRKMKRLQKAGEKNNLDILTIKNYIQMKRYDIKILNIQKQLLLLELYKKVSI